jgi:phosphatidylserine/phosphatidylglycerophosphate/cardiolipin synthase-like enzyme
MRAPLRVLVSYGAHARVWLGALVAVVAAAVRPVEGAPPAPATVQVCFVPPDDCSALIIGAISGARSGIRVAAYELTSAPIEAALIGAHQRGIL